MGIINGENLKAISKAFKKIKGVSPKEYRLKKKDTTEKFLLNEIK